MVKITHSTNKVKLQKGNKIIERDIVDYKTNKAMWDIRGFKVVQDEIKEVKKVNDDKVVELKPKKKKTRKKK
jgi:putative NADH-flavin reductase|tara:strand:+ start:63 stop:278 length:216 start_codon:yes stop_codon:yes gene_type:complete